MDDSSSFPFAKMTKLFSKIIDLSKPCNHKKIAFAFWSICKTFATPRTIHGEFYDAYEFSCTFEEIAESLGVTLSIAKGLVKFFNDIGWLIKSPNQVKNRTNRFKWDEKKLFPEKIVSIQGSKHPDEEKIADQNAEKIADQNLEKNPVHNSQKCPTDLGVKTPKKCPTKNDVNNPIENKENSRPTQKIADQIADRFRSENTQKIADQVHASLRTKESICLKETNINKEKEPIPIVDKDLSLFHGEKDLFNASKENELKEQQMTLEALVEMRNINVGFKKETFITSKTISRWLIEYSYQDVMDAIYLMLSNDHKKPENPGGWVQTALQKGWPKQERIKKQNLNFAMEIKEKNRLKHLKINSRYCVDLRTQKDYYYGIDPKIFETEIRKCLYENDPSQSKARFWH
jgi:hypothetical protein